MLQDNINLQAGFSFGGWLPNIIPELNNKFKLPYSKEEKFCDEFFQFEAFLAGMQKASIANPNPSVGCIIVKDNKIIARGCTDIWQGIHAEQEAFNQVNDVDLTGAKVYLTLEPCTHEGYQPPCIKLFKDRGITKVIISHSDLNPKVYMKGIEILKTFNIEIGLGLLRNEVRAWTYPFFIQQKFQRPMLALKWAQSLDGSLADDNNNSKWISGTISRKYTHWLRQKYDAIMIGVHTLLQDIPSLTVREIDTPYKRDPLRIIVDPNARILLINKDLQNLLQKNFLKKKIKTLFLIEENMLKDISSISSPWFDWLQAKEHIKFLPVTSRPNIGFANSLVASLLCDESIAFFGRPLQSIFVEGGSRLLSMFIAEQFFDVAHVFIAPFVLGGAKHRIMYPKNSLMQNITAMPRWSLLAQAQLGNDLLLEMVPNDSFEQMSVI